MSELLPPDDVQTCGESIPVEQLREIVLPALNKDSMDAEHEALSEIGDLIGIEYDGDAERYIFTK